MPTQTARYFRYDSGNKTLYRLDGGIERWNGSGWEKAPESVYDDFAEGATSYDEISGSEAKRLMSS